MVAVGVIGYVVTRLVTARFYAPLGVRPEDLGLGYPALLERSVGTLLTTMYFTVLLLGPLVLLGRMS